MNNTTVVNGIKYCWNEDIIYYYCLKRNRYIPCRNMNKELNRSRFFIDDTILDYNQISNYETYKSIRDTYIQFEEWRESSEFPGYLFSSLGRLKLKNGAISNISPRDDGYIKVTLSGKNGKLRISYHRALAFLFLPNDDPLNKTEVNHINGIRHDNRVFINLEWISPSENTRQRVFTNKDSGKKQMIAINEFNSFGQFVKRWESTSQIVNEKTGNDTIYYNLDTGKPYLGSYWYREVQSLLEDEEFVPLYLSDIDTTIHVSNKGRVCNTSTLVNKHNNITFGSKARNEYMRISIKNKEYKIHQLVLMAFDPDGNIDGKYVPDHVDGSRTNNNLENLEWVSYSENTQRYHAGKTKKQNNNSSTSRRVTFNQVGTNNEWIYQSIVEAIEKTKFTKSQINSFLGGKYKNNLKNEYGEFTVRYTDDIQKVKQMSSCVVPVIQLDLNDNEICRYESITKASEQTGILRQNIVRVCKGEGISSGGFKWKYANDDHNSTRNREVIQLDNDQNFIAYYSSIVEAVKATNIYDNSITSVCRNTSISAGGYKWMYKEDYIEMINKQLVNIGTEISNVQQQNNADFVQFYLKQQNQLNSILTFIGPAKNLYVDPSLRSNGTSSQDKTQSTETQQVIKQDDPIDDLQSIVNNINNLTISNIQYNQQSVGTL